METGDCVWRMPLFEHYTRQVVDCQLADVNNIGKYRYVKSAIKVYFTVIIGYQNDHFQ